MSFTVRGKAFICVFSYLLIVLLEYIVISNVDFDNSNLLFVSCIVLMNLFVQLVILKINGIHLYSFLGVFIIFYSLIHFGQIIMVGLFPSYQYDYMNYVSVYMKDSSLLSKTILLCLLVIDAFFIGAMIYHCKPKVYTEYNYKKVTSNYLNTALMVFMLLAPFRLLFDITYMIKAFSGGYHATMGSGLPGVFSAFATMWYVVVPILYSALNDSRIKRRFITIVSIYVVLTMFTGRRGHVVIGLASLAVVALTEAKTIPIKKIIQYSLLLIAGLFLLDLIYEVRHYSVHYFLEHPGKYLKEVFSNNILLETIGTFGETIYTPYIVIKEYGTVVKPFFGECFIKSIASIVPDVFGWFKNINNEAIYSRMLQTTHAIGGSFAGEMYYNFGNWYPVFSLIFGFIFGRYSHKVDALIKKGYLNDLVSSISFCSLSLWWIRDNIGNMVRQYVWLILLFYLIDHLITRIRKKRS